MQRTVTLSTLLLPLEAPGIHQSVVYFLARDPLAAPLGCHYDTIGCSTAAAARRKVCIGTDRFHYRSHAGRIWHTRAACNALWHPIGHCCTAERANEAPLISMRRHFLQGSFRWQQPHAEKIERRFGAGGADTLHGHSARLLHVPHQVDPHTGAPPRGGSGYDTSHPQHRTAPGPRHEDELRGYRHDALGRCQL